MKARPYSSWISRLYLFAMTMLAFTGMMQLPLAKRYYLTEVPGMAWTGDFFFTHKLHYMFAVLLLFIVGLVAVHWLLEWKDRLVFSSLGKSRVVVMGVLIVSGGLRVYRNFPEVTLSPAMVTTIEWAHLISAMIMGGLALAALFRKSSAWAKLR